MTASAACAVVRQDHRRGCERMLRQQLPREQKAAVSALREFSR